MMKQLWGRVVRVSTKTQEYSVVAAVASIAVAVAYTLRATVDPAVVHLFDVNIAFTDIVSVPAALGIHYAADKIRTYIRNKRKTQITISDVAAAIETKTLKPVFQPIYKLTSNEITGFEVLARMEHPVYGSVAPIEFIPLIETAPPDVTQRFTEYMLRETAKCFHELHSRGKDYQMSINIFANDLIDARVISSISRALVQHDMPFEYLTLEVTETALMKDLNQAIKVLASLDTMDVKLALDDYGTHIVSFLRFSRGMWVDEVKVSSKIACNVESLQHHELMLAILKTARDAGISVTVIRVKNSEELEIAKQMGVDYVQGNVIGHPMDITELVEWLDANNNNRPN